MPDYKFLTKHRGVYYVRYKTPEGNYRQVSTHTRNQREAAKFMRDFRPQANSFSEPTPTVRDLGTRFLQWEKQNHAPTTVRTTQLTLNQFLPLLGDKPVTDVTINDIQRYKAHRLTARKDYKPVSVTTMNIELRHIKMMFYYGIEKLEWLDKNPVPRRLLKVGDAGKRLPLTMEQFQSLYKAFGMKWMRDLVLFAVLTGLRRRELVSLRWMDVDYKRKRIRVIGKGNKERYVALNAQAIQVLDGINPRYEYVFTMEKGEAKGQPLKLNRATQVVTEAKTRAGLKGKICLHALRHTFATMALEHGATPQDVQKQMGHAFIQTTMDYVKMLDDAGQRAVAHLPVVDVSSPPTEGTA